MRDPGSRWLPLPEAGAPDGYTKTQFIVHSTGDNGAASNVEQYFARGDVVVESTFIVGLTPEDPTLQIMDSTDNADANLSANQRAISVETVGDGTGPFTDWQVKELIRIGRWAAAHHPIALRVCRNDTDSGFGWHVMFGAPGPWTAVRGKICPGPVRITQLQQTIFPAIFAGATPAPDHSTEEPTMLLVRNSKGAVALLADTFGVAVPGGGDPSYGALQKVVPEALLSDAFFDRLLVLAGAAGQTAGSVKHLEAIVGDWAVREQKEQIDDLAKGDEIVKAVDSLNPAG